MMFYLTKSRIKVQSIGLEKVIDGKLKVPCRRVDTGGWHGWLRLDRLTPVHERVGRSWTKGKL